MQPTHVKNPRPKKNYETFWRAHFQSIIQAISFLGITVHFFLYFCYFPADDFQTSSRKEVARRYFVGNHPHIIYFIISCFYPISYIYYVRMVPHKIVPCHLFPTTQTYFDHSVFFFIYFINFYFLLLECRTGTKLSTVPFSSRQITLVMQFQHP